MTNTTRTPRTQALAALYLPGSSIKAVVFHLDWKAVDADTRFKVTFDADVDTVRRLYDGSRDTYRKVAELTTDDLDDIYRDTNHIERDWRENESVFWATDKARSTSVGDVIVTRAGTYMVAGIGFTHFDTEAA